MRGIYRALQAERLKIKRTLAFRLALGCPVIIVLLVFGIYVQRGEKAAGANVLTGFAQQILTIWTIILFPLYAALAAALLAALEHQNETWKHMLALPIKRYNIFLAKWIAGLGLLFLSSLVVAGGVIGTSAVLRLTKPSWGSPPLPSLMILRGTALSCCAACLLFSIQMWISLRWRSFLPGLLVAVIALVVMFVAIPRGVAMFGSLFPWSLPALAMAPHNPYWPIAAGLGSLGGAVVGRFACWSLSRREFF